MYELNRSTLYVAAVTIMVVASGITAPRAANAYTLTVAAAADLRKAFDEIGTQFGKKTRNKVIFTYGSSGLLAKQIEQGAPFDVFAAANVKYIDDLVPKGAIKRDSRIRYAQGQLTMWTKKNSNIKPHRLQDLIKPNIRRIAIANPEHAPYGQAAKEAFQSVGIWEKVKPKLVYGENIAQTLQFAQSGNVDVAIVALSLSIGSGGRYTGIPGELHKPITQAMGIVTATKVAPVARQFQQFVMSSTGKAILRKYGFLIPGERAVH